MVGMKSKVFAFIANNIFATSAKIYFFETQKFENPGYLNSVSKVTYSGSKLFILICFPFLLCSQNEWLGRYNGTFEGDAVFLEFSDIQNGQLSGKMQDSYNAYAIVGTTKKSTFTGTAQENSLGITFAMTAVKQGTVLTTKLVFEFLGTQKTMDIVFEQIVGIQNSEQQSSKTTSSKNPVSGKLRDKNITGLWSKESNYSSGYGSNDTYGSMSSKEYLEFLADGRIATAGSSTLIGGANYTGVSSETGRQIAEGWYWYSENSRIYLHISQQGQVQTVALGKYYIENGRMLITADNGVKMLLTRE